MAAGLAQAVGPENLTVIVNTADDFCHLGLAISPDLDTVMYTLAGLESRERGWGLENETWSFMAALGRLGGETWFQLGDRDMATHVERSRRLAAGETLTEVTRTLCNALGIGARVVPMTNDRVATVVETDEGPLAFQDYFVRRRCEPRIASIAFQGAGSAHASPAATDALMQPGVDAIVVCPSNPYVSVAPILAIAPIRRMLESRCAPLVAVSPIVGGAAVKGPAAKIMRELAVEPSALGIARHYRGLIDGLVVDDVDRSLSEPIAALGISVHVTDTIMRGPDERRRLAAQTLKFAATLRPHGGTSGQ
jgi:LPPG:FO 2-phospho-L-lactate transferase